MNYTPGVPKPFVLLDLSFQICIKLHAGVRNILVADINLHVACSDRVRGRKNCMWTWRELR